LVAVLSGKHIVLIIKGQAVKVVSLVPYVSLSPHAITVETMSLPYVFKTGQHNGNGEDLLASLCMYIPYVIKCLYKNGKCFNTRRRGNKIHFLYIKLLDNIRRKPASGWLPQETLAFPVVKIHQIERKIIYKFAVLRVQCH